MSFDCTYNDKKYENGRWRHCANAFWVAWALVALSSIVHPFLTIQISASEQNEENNELPYSEARGVKSDTQKACVAWTILNRVDAGYGTIQEVVSAEKQFAYFEVDHIPDDIYTIAADVVVRWSAEKSGENDVGRVLPKGYLWFHGDGKRNYFRNAFRGNTYWDYSLESPYKN